MFAIKCRCGATNDGEAVRCSTCGADLTPETPETQRTNAMLVAVVVLIVSPLFAVALLMAGPPSISRRGFLVDVVYSLVGFWPPLLMLWVITAVILFRAWRRRA